MSTEELIRLIKLIEDLGPNAVALVHALIADLSGKPDDAILDEADATFDRVIQKVKASLS